MSETSPLQVSILSPDVDRSGGVGTLYKYAAPFFPDSVRVTFLDTRGKNRYPAASAISVLRVMTSLLVQKISGRVDLVHINLGTRGSTVRKIALATWCHYVVRIPYVVQLHTSGFRPFYDSLPKPIRHYIVHILNRSSRILALGQVWKAMLIEIGCNPELIHVFVMGVPKIDRAQIPVTVASKEDEYIYLLFAGDLAEWKGLHFLLESLSMVKKENVRLIIAGKGDLSYWRTLARKFTVESEVVFLGLMTPGAVHTLLSLVDALVLPSKAEGLPVCVLEALSAGIPVLSSKTGSLEEFTAENHDIIFMENIEPETIAATIYQWRHSKPSNPRLAQEARGTWAKYFDASKTTPELCKHWQIAKFGEIAASEE